ncbi:MAG: hypothetical protein Q9O24_00930 [Gammaproteobacteria bacterium]|nr:hypothetical protein [Gammaproteobacteria bacterium]
MITWLNTLYFQLHIKLLVMFKPTLLFDKINQLDWYKNTLQQWAVHQEP